MAAKILFQGVGMGGGGIQPSAEPWSAIILDCLYHGRFRDFWDLMLFIGVARNTLRKPQNWKSMSIYFLSFIQMYEIFLFPPVYKSVLATADTCLLSLKPDSEYSVVEINSETFGIEF
jgi:hypothetical protein